MKVPLAIVVLLAGTSAAMAETCESYSFDDAANFVPGRVIAKGKTYFQNDDKSQDNAYLIHGDEVVVLSREGGRSCVVYVSPNAGGTFGWLPDRALAPSKTGTGKWKGRFVRDELGSQVVLKPVKGGKIDVTMEAYWAMSIETARQGGVNEGGMGDVVPVKDGVLHIPSNLAEGNNCEADLRLIGTKYLLVQDNRDKLGDDILTCAGHNVHFTGLYVRTK